VEDSFDYKKEAEESNDKDYDKVLRPKLLNDFAGQEQIVDNLSIFVKAAKLRNEPLITSYYMVLQV
jgi:holliday junction DNA helicase RuvB